VWKLQSHTGLHGKLTAGVIRTDHALKRLRTRFGKQCLQGTLHIVQIHLHTGDFQTREGMLALGSNQKINALFTRRCDIRRRAITVARRD